MDSKQTAATSKPLELRAKAEWVHDEESSTLQVELSEFQKEELKVQLDTMGNLRIIGERKADGAKPILFRRTLRVPENCRQDGIKAKFNNGVLHVIMPLKEPSKKMAMPESKQCIDETHAGRVTEPGLGSEKERKPRDAGESVNALDAKKDKERDPNFGSRLGLGLKTRNMLFVSVGVGIAAVAIALGLFAAYRLGTSMEEGY